MKWPLVFALVLPIAAEARPLKDLCDQFEPLRKLGDLRYINVAVRVEPESKSVRPEQVAFIVHAKAGDIRIVPAADGRIEFPLTAALCAENPDIESNQPPGSLSMSVMIDPSVPPARSFDYRLLDALRREWDEAVSRQSLMWRLLAPSAKGYTVLFEPGRAASAEIRLPEGVRRLAADAKGELRIPIEAAWVAANPAIVLSEVPKKITLAFKS